MVKVEAEAPVLWRKPSETAPPSTLDKRVSPQLYPGVAVLLGEFDWLDTTESRTARFLRGRVLPWHPVSR